MVCIRLLVHVLQYTRVFSNALLRVGGGGLKHLLTNLQCTKCIEVNIRHSYLQKHVS